jgi:4-hydroxythreonine-4-phosphate dehydrogenase
MGDPAGVGPELCLRVLADPGLTGTCRPVVFGDAVVLRRVADRLGWGWRDDWVVADIGDAPATGGAVWHLPVAAASAVEPGRFTAATGAAAFRFIEAAIAAVLGGAVDAVTTGPINKEALHAAGVAFPGHTEIFAERTGAARWCMMQFSPEVTCTFVTVHVGYAEVPALLTPARVLDVIELTAEAMLRLRGRAPRLAVCGLNPHAGEHGLFGNREEETSIIPAIERARALGIDVAGPLPPDTAFLPARRRATDAFVCMYHDQGHIPLKALAFDSAVNTTLGLPVIRTSVDHGTAGDIAWQGIADPGSLYAAIRLAARLARPAPASGRKLSTTP